MGTNREFAMFWFTCNEARRCKMFTFLNNWWFTVNLLEYNRTCVWFKVVCAEKFILKQELMDLCRKSTLTLVCVGSVRPSSWCRWLTLTTPTAGRTTASLCTGWRTRSSCPHIPPPAPFYKSLRASGGVTYPHRNLFGLKCPRHVSSFISFPQMLMTAILLAVCQLR